MAGVCNGAKLLTSWPGSKGEKVEGIRVPQSPSRTHVPNNLNASHLTSLYCHTRDKVFNTQNTGGHLFKQCHYKKYLIFTYVWKYVFGINP
jgi:hypothetical protein